jgi:hypothetical protein
MKSRLHVFYLAFLLILLSFFGLRGEEKELTVKEIVARNIQAACDVEKLKSFENISFSTGQYTYYMAMDGRMKITSGTAPVITKSFVIDKNGARKNSFNNITELKPLVTSTYQAQALLRSGLYTLINFEDNLEYVGLKRFGIKSHHVLTTELGKLIVEFYLDPDEFLLKRMVFKGYDPGQGTYEINHDFGPYQEVNGVRLPSSWFTSQVGTRGVLYEIQKVKFNLSLKEDFFSNLDLNMGKVEISTGMLGGNIIDHSFRRNTLTLETNWTLANIQSAGFINNDSLRISIKGKEYDITFYNSSPPRNSIKQGAVILMPNRRDENYIISMYSAEFKDIVEKLELFQPIELKQK